MAVVIVGAGHAGGQVAASLRQLKYEGPITLIGGEPSLPYQRPPLTKEYLRGEFDTNRLLIRPEAFYDNNDITTVMGRLVTAVDQSRQKVLCDDGSHHTYDSLVLTTGSYPIKPDIPGIDLKGVHLLRTTQDVDQITSELKEDSTVAVIGGGYIGLEAAASLQQQGCEVYVFETEDRLLKRVATEELSSFFYDIHSNHGINFCLNTQVTEISGDQNEHVTEVTNSNGYRVDVDMVVVGVGIRPAISLAEQMNLRCKNGVWVDEHTRTSSPNVYAAGDCTNHPNSLLDTRLRLESVPNAMEQARTTASNLLGNDSEYAAYPWFWSDQYDLKLQMVGFGTDRDVSVSRGNRADNSFIDFHMKEGVLIGADAVNSPRMFMAARRLVGQTLSATDLANEELDLKQLLAS